MQFILIGALLALALLLQSEPAHAFDYLNSQGRMWILDRIPDQPRYGPVGLHYPGSRFVNWAVAQWGIPANLPNTSTWLNPGDHAAGWQVANQHGRVKWMRPGIVEIGQSNSGLACGTEYDLFVSPTGEVSSPHTFAAFEEQVPLSGISSLRTGVKANLFYEEIVPRCPLNLVDRDPDDYVNYVLAIVFQASWTEGQTAKIQILNYQINLGYKTVNDYSFCPPPDAGPVKYCVDDPVKRYINPATNLPEPTLTPGATRRYDLEIRNRIATIIQAGQGLGLHQDLSHWKIAGAYYGTLIKGGVIVTTRWDGFTLAAN